MGKYVYSLVKELNQQREFVNYLCKDNYIHIRLRDFGNKKEVISGLEDKLTFYIVLQLNKLLPKYLEESLFDITNKDKYDEIFKACINKFKCSPEYTDLKLILHCLYPECLGINILPRYSKKDSYSTVLSKFGSVDLTLDDDFNVYKFLTNESIFIVIDDKKKVNCTKYIKKYANKNRSLAEE